MGREETRSEGKRREGRKQGVKGREGKGSDDGEVWIGKRKGEGRDDGMQGREGKG